MRDEDLTAICDRTKKKKEAGILTRAFPLESPSKNYAFLGILERLSGWKPFSTAWSKSKFAGIKYAL